MKALLTPIIALAAASCAPKPQVAEKSQQPVKNTTSSPTEQTALPQIKPTAHNDGLRINEDDLLSLPTNDQLRPRKNAAKTADTPIIVNPPHE